MFNMFTGLDQAARPVEGTDNKNARVFEPATREDYANAGLLNTQETSAFLPELTIEDVSAGAVAGLTSLLEEAKAKAPIDQEEMKRVAFAINEACNGGFLGWGTDYEKIKDLLQDKTKAEIEAIDNIFNEEFGTKFSPDGTPWGLDREFRDEMSGATLDRALSLLNGIDANNGGDAARIHAALIERGQGFFGHTDETCEQEIRSKLLTMNSQQISQLEQDYKRLFQGSDLRSDLLNNPNLSPETKTAIEIYLKGIDKKTDDDTRTLAEAALGSGNVKIFQEAFSDASANVRMDYLSMENLERIKNAFGQVTDDGSRVESTQSQIAKDFVERGSINPITELKEHQTWFGDSEKGIEQTISNMSEIDRRLYIKGHEIANDLVEIKSDTDKAALSFYQKLKEELKDAGNSTEVLKWEDLILHRGGSLVGVLAEHRGAFNDDEAAVYKAIKNMSQNDWMRLKINPGFRKSIDDVLSTYLSESELTKAQQLLDEKAAVALDLNNVNQSYNASTQAGLRSMEETIAESYGSWSTDRNAIYDAITRMTPEEQASYRQDESYRKNIDEMINEALFDGAQLDVATGMLAKVMQGDKPEQGLVEKINMAALGGTQDLSCVVREIEQAFANDPSLQKRLTNPESDEDKKLANAFESAIARHVVVLDSYDTYIKPLLESPDGRLPLEVKIQLNRGDFNDDERGFYKDVLAATHEEREKLAVDRDYQNLCLGALSNGERDLAIHLAKQGKMQPEDELRACILGVGTDELGIKKLLASMTHQEIANLKEAYGNKYGSDLISDLHDELGSQDKAEVRRLLEEKPGSVREQFNRDQDRYFDTRDGVGSKFVDAVWDGTGLSLDNAMNSYQKAIADYARQFKELPEEEQRRLIEKVNAAADLFIESKGAAADALADALLSIGAVGGAAFTGGASLTLLAFVAAGGAALKVSTKALIMGGDYDWSSIQPLIDGTTGALDSTCNFVGAAELQKVLGMSKYGAVAASGFLGGGVAGTTRAAFNWDANLSVAENFERLVQSGLTSAMIGAGAAVTLTGIIDGVSTGVRAVKGVSDSTDNLATRFDDTPENVAPESASRPDLAPESRLSSQVDDVIADSSDNVAPANVANDAVADTADNIAAARAGDMAADNADILATIKRNPTELLDEAQTDALFKQLAGAEGTATFRKNPELRYSLSQVDAANHPNGIIIATKESKIVLRKPLELANGTVLPEGTVLPPGVQISPGNLQSVSKDVNNIIGGKIIVPGDGIKLADGTILRSADIADNADFQIFKGQIAKPQTAKDAAEWIVLREVKDADGNIVRYDAYTNSNSSKLKKWSPVEGESGVYNPILKPDEPPRVMVKLPDDFRGEIPTVYGNATAGEPSFLVQHPDGKGYYLISNDDLVDTMLAIDARSQSVLDSLKPAQAVASLDKAIARTADSAPQTGTSVIRENGRVMTVINSEGTGRFAYNESGELIEATVPGSTDTWKKESNGWIAYNNKTGAIAEDRLTDIHLSVSPEGNVTIGNLGYLDKMVHRADGMTEYHVGNGSYRVFDANNRFAEVRFQDGVVARATYAPDSDVITRLDLSDNSSIIVENGRLSIVSPGSEPVLYPGNGEIRAPLPDMGDDGFRIKFGNRDITMRLNEDVSENLSDLTRVWSSTKVASDGSFQRALDRDTIAFRDGSERLTRVERNGQVTGSFKYGTADTSNDLIEVNLEGPNGFRAQKVEGHEDLWRISEGSAQYDYKGKIQIVTDPSGMGLAVRRENFDELEELFNLNGSAITYYPTGGHEGVSELYKDRNGQVTHAISGNRFSGFRTASYKYAEDGSGLLAADFGEQGLKATRVSNDRWLISGHGPEPYYFEGKLEVNNSGSLSKITDNGIRETFRPNGSRSIAFGDGTMISIDHKGRVVAAESANNGTFQFQYTGDKLTTINAPQMRARQIGTDRWSITAGDGSTSMFNGRFSVNEAGYIWKESATGEVEHVSLI